MGSAPRSGSRPGGECLDDGADVVAYHFLVGVDVGAIGDEGLGEGDTGVLGESGEDFMIGFFFRENGGDLMVSELLEQGGELGGAGGLFAIDSLHGEGGELIVLAQVTEGVMCRGEMAVFLGDLGDFLARPAVKVIEARAVGAGVFFKSGALCRGGDAELGGDDRGGAAEVVDGMPPVGIDGVMMLRRFCRLDLVFAV